MTQSGKGKIIVIGGGLAGSEASWQIASRGIKVDLFEMRPFKTTGAHQTENFAELVCSNSLGSRLETKASGLLLAELKKLNSLLVHCAEKSSLPAGTALAVDRDLFSRSVTDMIRQHPLINIIHEEVINIPEQPSIIASGPLTSPNLCEAIKNLTGAENLFFYDAVAPTITAQSLNFDRVFKASRYARGENEDGDYLNCPLSKQEYELFVSELIHAKRYPLRDFEADINSGVTAGKSRYFEGCLPVEVLAHRDMNALSFGPMRPVGLIDPGTGKRPYAVLQLRQDNIAADIYSMVGFQTNLTQEEQKRVFRLIPGLESVEFVRFGQMHRNTYISSPELLRPTLQYNNREELFFAGQIAGIEGYLGNIASGLLAGINAVAFLKGKPLIELPRTTMIGALIHYITHCDVKHFQPMKANFGIIEFEKAKFKNKTEKYEHAYRISMQTLSTLSIPE